MTATTPGREIVQIVEIVQPLCSRVYGVSPCTASGTADEKCYNTRATCQDTANFALGTPLSLFFSRGHVAEQTVNLSKIIEISSIPAQNDSTWTLRSFDASAYIGKNVRLIIRYQSGSTFQGDAQFDDFTNNTHRLCWVTRANREQVNPVITASYSKAPRFGCH